MNATPYTPNAKPQTCPMTGVRARSLEFYQFGGVSWDEVLLGVCKTVFQVATLNPTP